MDVRDIKIHDLRGLMGNVNQEAILFNDTFFNNITFGVKNPTMEDVVAAAKIANAHDFIMATPDGYNTNIGDRGGKLSGGQRQRISIARKTHSEARATVSKARSAAVAAAHALL